MLGKHFLLLKEIGWVMVPKNQLTEKLYSAQGDMIGENVDESLPKKCCSSNDQNFMSGSGGLKQEPFQIFFNNTFPYISVFKSYIRRMLAAICEETSKWHLRPTFCFVAILASC